jgi:hypothetical protein
MFTTGVGGIVGDKGALGISLQFNHTSICFVPSLSSLARLIPPYSFFFFLLHSILGPQLTCHLAPHEGGWLTRNAHVQAIAHGLQLGTQVPSLFSPHSLSNEALH